MLGEARGVTCERVPSARARTVRYWPIVGRGADSMGVFTARGVEDEEPLPVFSIGEEALLYISMEETERDGSPERPRSGSSLPCCSVRLPT